MKRPNAWRVIALLCGAAALGGCAATNVGGDWQCPLRQGTPCLSVAGADPAAAQNRTAVRTLVLQETRVESGSDGRSRVAGRTPTGGRRPVRRVSAEESPTGPGACDGSCLGAAAGAGAPAEPVSWIRGDGLPASNSTRTSEAIGRIWIGPYVDDNGVYHEAGWVQAVLEPARWRLP